MDNLALMYEDDRQVAGLLYALLQYCPEGLNIPQPSEAWLGMFLGHSGRQDALEAHQSFDLVDFSEQPYMAWVPEADNRSIRTSASHHSHPPPTTSSPAQSVSSASSLPPHSPYPSLSPTASSPVQSVASGSTPPPPQADRTSRKRTNRPPATEAAQKKPPAKRQRSSPQCAPGKVTCRWDGCGEEIDRAKWMEHCKRKHFMNRVPNQERSARIAAETAAEGSGMPRKNVHPPEVCLWADCKKRQGDPQKSTFVDLQALHQHLRREHYETTRKGSCRYCGVQDKRSDALARHEVRCHKNPANRQ
ncbi:hypothetical protein BD413DRAFT_607673 [Trametes elegans]|nr:hypothetical protein BD413DRAFT_607673 [Trametes elegans]